MTDTFERTQLDGKDRGQLSEIASALGVKAVSRMRKADLVDAIVAATAGSNGSEASKPRKIRSTVPAGDDLASLADEQNALAAADEPVDEMALIRRRPGGSPDNGNGSAPSPSTSAPPTTSGPVGAPQTDDEDLTVGDDRSSNGGGPSSQPLQSRDDDGQGNRTRRRRRRGRDRDRPAGGVSIERGEPREAREDFSGDLIELEGLLDLRDEGYGFLRTSGYLAGRNDAYVSASQVRRFGLRKGDYVKGASVRPRVPRSTRRWCVSISSTA